MNATPKPNFTAWFVMQGMLAAMKQPDLHDFTNDMPLMLYQPLSDASSKTRLASRIIHSLPYSWQYRIGEWVTNPGRLRHFCFRKMEIEKRTRALLAQGNISQVIVLGAGLDVLSMRLAAEYPAVNFVEIDVGESQAFKSSAFSAHGIALPSNVDFIEGDLRNPLAKILAGARRFAPDTPTLWIAEGFFMFIPEESVLRIFSDIKQLCTPGSHIIFTTLPTKKQGTPIGHLIQKFYLIKEKSPFHWVIPSQDVPLFLKNQGYAVIAQIPCDALHKSYMGQKFNSNPYFAEDMHIAIAQNM